MNQDKKTAFDNCCSTSNSIDKNLWRLFRVPGLWWLYKSYGPGFKNYWWNRLPADFNGITFLAKIQADMNHWQLISLIISKHFNWLYAIYSFKMQHFSGFFRCCQDKSKHLRIACQAPHSLAPAYSFSPTFDLSLPFTAQMLQWNKLISLFLPPKDFSFPFCLCPFYSSRIP